MLARLIGLGLLLLGIYFLGQNIYFTTNPYPYWWRGIAADSSILCLTAGVLLFFALPSREKMLAFFCLLIGILLVFISSKAILKPTSLWQFVLSLFSFYAGSELFTKGRLRL